MAFLPIVAAAAGIAGAGVSAVGAVESGEATANAANYQAEVARNNATIAQQNAVYASRAGQAQAQQENLKNAARYGQTVAGLAANGVDVNSGSSVNVESSEREQGELDTQTTLNNAELQAYGYKTQATGYQAQAGLDEAEAAQAPIGAGLTAAGGLLSNASALSFKWPTLGGSGVGANPYASYPTIAEDQP